MEPKLTFPEASVPVGRSYAIAEHGDASAPVAVRELIQNAMDAHAELEGPSRDACHVSFEVQRIQKKDIPDFDVYQNALDLALEYWSGNKAVARHLNGIKNYTREDEIDLLCVSDTGKGMDATGMDSMLSEGAPEKKSGSSGAFGVGHLTAYGLSGLKYIFYGGKRQGGHIVGAGHALLASFIEQDERLRSDNGYYVKEFKGLFDNLFIYHDNKDLPDFLVKKLARIEKSGSVIAILGFNWFKVHSESHEERDKIVQELILEAVAKNFAIAICAGELKVSVKTSNDTVMIDESSVIEFLQMQIDKKSDESASRTIDMIRTYKNPDVYSQLEGEFSDCEIRQRNGTQRHSASIWRNGMLIMERHQGLSRSMFGSKKLLNAVVLFSGRKNPRKSHDLIKNAETPMHDRIQSNRLDSEKEISNLRDLMTAIREWINHNAEETGDETTDLSDEIILSTGSSAQIKRSRPPIELRDSIDDDDAGVHGEGHGGKDTAGGSKGEGRTGKKAIIRKAAQARVQGKAISNQSYHIRLLPGKKLEKAVVKISIDNGVDASCVGNYGERQIEIASAKYFGEDGGIIHVKDGNLILDEGVKKDEPIEIQIEFDRAVNDVDAISLGCLLGSSK